MKLVNTLDWGESSFWHWQGFRCHWKVLGSELGKPLVLIHGFGASSQHWRNNAPFFARAGYRVYGLDLIGFGLSDQPGINHSLNIDNLFWAKQLIAFLEQVVDVDQRGRAVLVGNSLGSLTALTAVVERVDLVAAVVAAPLPDPALLNKAKYQITLLPGFLKRIFVKGFFFLLPIELILWVISRTFLLKVGLQAAYKRSIHSDKDLYRIVSKPVRRPTSARSLRAMCIGMTLRPYKATANSLLDRLAAITNRRPPFLLLWGEDDKFVPLALGELIQRDNPWIDFFVIESSGHCPHDESPELFNRYVLNWLGLKLEFDLHKV